MCFSWCTSLRGLVYFGASLFIIKGLGGLMDTLLALLDPEKPITTVEFDAYQIWSIIRSLLITVFGCLCFRGVERTSIVLLKFSPAALLALQIAHTAIRICLAPPNIHPWTIELSQKIVSWTILLIEPAAFLAVVILYILKLRKDELLATKEKIFLQKEHTLLQPEDFYN